MGDLLPQIGLVAVLVSLNAAFAGSELALVSLREGQLQRLEERGGSGKVLARLARDPNRFLATIQIGITLAGFLASASAAVSLAEPLEKPLAFLGDAAGPAAVIAVTLILSYVTLVFGELAPKRIAMQRAERWGLLAARPLSAMATMTRPVVWVLSRSADLVVRLVGADPSRQREDVTHQEIRDMIAAQKSFTIQQRAIIEGAFEIAERSLRQVLRPRGDVVVLDATASRDEAMKQLIVSGHSRAPVGKKRNLDAVIGVVHLRDLVSGTGSAGDLATEALFFPETAAVLDALRELQQRRQQLAIVVNEHGGTEGIVTVEDLIEEIVGEIWDETDRDVRSVSQEPGGALVLPGRFPVHDLPDLRIDLPAGGHATVAGIVLGALGRIPQGPGDTVAINGWVATILAVEGHAITRIRLNRPSDDSLVDVADDH